MPNLDDLLRSPQAEKLMGDGGKLEHLKNAPETRQLFSMLSKSAGGNLEQAADNAARGDSAQLLSAIRLLMQDPEGARLIRQVKEKLN